MMKTRKPEKRVEMMAKAYWTCVFEDHRHRTEKAATRCIAMRGTQRPTAKDREQRARTFTRKCMQGFSHKQISEGYQVCKRTVHNDIARQMQRLRRTGIRVYNTYNTPLEFDPKILDIKGHAHIVKPLFEKMWRQEDQQATLKQEVT